MDRKRLVKDLIKDKQSDLTASERKVTALLQDDSMVAGLQSITKLAEDAGVSTPTIIRLARKLGFEGFPDLQNAIRDEVAARMREPLAKLEMAERADHQDHIVSRFAVAMAHNINRTIDRLDLAEFDEVAGLLSDPARTLFLLGGRITRSNAHYFYNHLQIIRSGVSALDSYGMPIPIPLESHRETPRTVHRCRAACDAPLPSVRNPSRSTEAGRNDWFRMC